MALVGLIGAMNNGWSRIFIGWFADNYSYKTSKIIILMVHIISFVMLILASDNIYVYMVANALIFWSTGCHYVNVMV